MEGVNKATLIGTVGKDPEVKNINGQTLIKFSLATNRSYKEKGSNEWTKQVQWHSIEAWGSLADFMAKRVRKGKNAYIEGEIRYNEYEKDGQKRWSTVIMATAFRALDKETNGEAKATVSEEAAQEDVKKFAQASAPTASAPTRTASSADVMNGSGSDEDDLPF